MGNNCCKNKYRVPLIVLTIVATVLTLILVSIVTANGVKLLNTATMTAAEYYWDVATKSLGALFFVAIPAICIFSAIKADSKGLAIYLLVAASVGLFICLVMQGSLSGGDAMTRAMGFFDILLAMVLIPTLILAILNLSSIGKRKHNADCDCNSEKK